MGLLRVLGARNMGASSSRIRGTMNYKRNEIDEQIQRGARFVQFEYVVSVLYPSFIFHTDTYFLRPNQPCISCAGFWKALFVSLLCGWTSIIGPFLTLLALGRTLSGGRNVTSRVLTELRNNFGGDESGTYAPPVMFGSSDVSRSSLSGESRESLSSFAASVPSTVSGASSLSPFLVAACQGEISQVIRMLENGEASPNEKSASGIAALQFAASRSNIKIMSLLLQHGANPNIRSPRGSYPVLESAFCGSIEGLKLLEQYGADLAVENGSGANALILASNAGHSPMVRYLLLKDIDPNHRSLNGSCALLEAVANGHLECVKALVSSGADANAINAHKMTPLHLAVQRERVEIIRVLVAAGARREMKEEHGWTPEDLVLKQRKPQWNAMLEALAGRDDTSVAESAPQ